MNLSQTGEGILVCEVTNITIIGFWVFVKNLEYFIPFKDYPDFIEATIKQICSVSFIEPDQLRWEELDIDIEIESLIRPKQYPLIFKK